MSKQSTLFFEIIQRDSEFAKVPIVWRAKKKGGRLHVTRQDERVLVEINVKGLSLDRVEELVRKALVYANEIYRGYTKASVIGGSLKEKGEGVKWMGTKREREEALKGAILERIDELFAA